MRKLLTAFTLIFLALLSPVFAGAFQPLKLVSEKGAFAYQVELANTEAKRERGLMFRRSMATDRGMLFDLGTDRVATMWMKNTFIPLDMVFIRANGEVASVAKNAEPQSLAVISSGVRVRAVLELNAGEADKIGLKPGDHVQHQMFKLEPLGR